MDNQNVYPGVVFWWHLNDELKARGLRELVYMEAKGLWYTRLSDHVVPTPLDVARACLIAAGWVRNPALYSTASCASCAAEAYVRSL